MPRRGEIEPPARRKIIVWRLTDYPRVEVNWRWYAAFRNKPGEQLARVRHPFNGMAYGFSPIGPANQVAEHLFAFHVVFGQDEQHLVIIDGYWIRRFGTSVPARFNSRLRPR